MTAPCAYCGRQTAVTATEAANQQQLARMPHSPVVTQLAPVCVYMARAIAKRGRRQ